MTARPTVLMVEQGGRGGIADYTGLLVEALVNEGWKVELATAPDHRYAPTAGVSPRGVFPYLRARGRLTRWARRLRLNKVVSGGGALLAVPRLVPAMRRSDVVHLQGSELPLLTLLLASAARVLRRPVIFTPHNVFDRDDRWGRTNRALWRAAQGLVVHARSDLAALPADVRTRAKVIPHGEYASLHRSASRPDPDAARRRLGIPDGRLVALLFGQLRADKGVVDALQATAAVPDFHLVIAGEDTGGLAAATSLLNDPALAARTTVREGFVPLEAAAELFAAADVVVLPYPRASQSGVLLLASGFERAVLAYPVGGLAETVIEGRTGWLAAEATPAALAAGLAEVARRGRAECVRRGVEARRHADGNHAWPAIARRTAALYRLARTAPRKSGQGDANSARR